MTERLYENDSYCRRFTATVVTCRAHYEGYAVQLDRTAFFPESGGQPSDTGWLDGIDVTAVSIDGQTIWHHTAAPLTVGETVTGEIRWDERFRRMQKHSAEHILAGLIHRQYGFENVGFHLGSQDVTLDMSGELTRAQLDAIEEEANHIVGENHPIHTTIPTAEELPGLTYRCKKEIDGPLRIVTIEGVDCCACCAPHVASTVEIGIIKILDVIRYKGGVRIHMQAGLDALPDYRMRYEQTAAAAALLSVKQDALTHAVERLLTERDGLKGALRDANRRLARMQALCVELTDDAVCLFGAEWDAETMRELVNTLSTRCGGICGAFTAAEDGHRYVIGGKGDIPAFCRRLHEALGGRGGGSAVMQQGRVCATEQQIRAFFEKQA